ncbi:MAG: exodeoxyribonuclease III [Bacteroidales bacterium]|nr:exodeoxyribonuclease III [Bacteroidales bacterium]
MTKIVSYNVNGIRSAINKGFFEWLRSENPDIIHIQETKAMQEQVDCFPLYEMGYEIFWNAAQKKGYSGVATFTKIKPKNVQIGIGHELFDSEGRFIRLDFDDYVLINSYFPSGTTGDVRQAVKEEYLESAFNYCKDLLVDNKNVILSGDFNICHKPIDINHPERHKNTSGFLPHEREWMDRMMNLGFIDSFRKYNDQSQMYSWWSYRAGSREKNLGWRIDYHLVSENLTSRLHNAKILPDVVHSDHCPVVVEI